MESVSPPDRKQRLAIPPQPIPEQEPSERVRNWEEVCLGFELGAAQIEATRCLPCPAAPCVKACPLHNNIPAALQALEVGEPQRAVAVFRLTSPMPEVCGRLCPQERLCEGACVVGRRSRPVAIGKLESFLGDFAPQPAPVSSLSPSASGRQVAVLGAGPAGLAAAARLRGAGHEVTVFDLWPHPGGLLFYGIPSFKLDKDVVRRLVGRLADDGVKFECGPKGAPAATAIAEGGGDFDAVLLAHGAGADNQLRIRGLDLPGVYTATEFLVRLNAPRQHLPRAMREPIGVGDTVIVLGGGDTAMDCARSAVRAGAREVVCLYRRSESEMGGRAEERTRAREEGVQFLCHASPSQISADPAGRGLILTYQVTRTGEPDAFGQRPVISVPDSQTDLRADTVVVAVGYRVAPELALAAGVEAAPSGTLLVGPDGGTRRPAVFAAGDCTNGPDLVVTAIASAHRAADAIDRYLASVAPR